MEDQEILELYQKRSEDAVFATSVKYGAYLRSIAGHILSNESDAEECVNDAYLKAWESIPPQRPRRFAAYLGKITRNLALDRLKLRRAQKRGSGEPEAILSEVETFALTAPGPEEGVESAVILELIDGFLREQKKEKRQVFLLRYWHFLTIEEISRKTGLSVPKIKSMLFRTRNELKILLEKEGVLDDKRENGRASGQCE